MAKETKAEVEAQERRELRYMREEALKHATALASRFNLMTTEEVLDVAADFEDFLINGNE